MRSRAIRRSWSTSARRRRRQARPGKRPTATAATCARPPTPPTAPTSNSGSRGWRPAAPQHAAPAAPAPAETPGEFGATPPTPSLVPPSPPAGRAPVAAARHRAAEPPAAGGQRLEPLQHHGGRVGERRGAAAGRRRAVRAPRPARPRTTSIACSGSATPIPRRRCDIPPIADQYEQAMADGPRNERNAKIAFVGSAVAAAVSATFFILDAKLGGQPAVAITPAGRGHRRHGRLAVAVLTRSLLRGAVARRGGAGGLLLRAPAGLRLLVRGRRRLPGRVQLRHRRRLPPRRRPGRLRHPGAD